MEGGELVWVGNEFRKLMVVYDRSRTAEAYKVGSVLTDDGVLASDHRQVFADLTI